ncbi:tyrosine kinase catalytic domain protein [Fusarium sp. NRRL 52700]|nr:tyrosine kinase catalytic domain protein [Fusarium sp. NRRL 52700]
MAAKRVAWLERHEETILTGWGSEPDFQNLISTVPGAWFPRINSPGKAPRDHRHLLRESEEITSKATMADLALAAYNGATDVFDRLERIIGRARELDNQCKEIGDIVCLLRDILQKRPTAITDSKVFPKLCGVLDGAENCIITSQNSMTNKTLEVLWRDSLHRVEKSLLVWTTYLTAENTLDSKEDVLKLLDESRLQHDRTDRYHAEILDKLSILEDIKNNQEGIGATDDAAVDFEVGDPRLQITTETSEELVGTLRLSDSHSVSIVCTKVKESLMRVGEKGPRHVSIYSKLSARCLVHPFYGIARYNGIRWLVFQDLRGSPSLANALSDERCLQEVMDRVRVAADVATTMTYLHSVEILLKSLTDQTVLLVTENSQLIPYLTELDRARMMSEITGGEKYDARYEAPEKKQIRQHTIQTDIWSLGILIWQCISREPPFNMNEKVLQGDQVTQIRESIEAGDLPWNLDQNNPVYAKVASLVRRCCSKDPRQRPSAMAVKDRLIEIMQTPLIPQQPQDMSDHEVNEQVLQQLDDVIKENKLPAECQLSTLQIENLKKRAGKGDGWAAYLFGSAVWQGLADPGSSCQHEPILITPGHELDDELRCRVAIEFLELAIRKHEKLAFKPLREAYKGLGEICKAQLKFQKPLKLRCT